MANDNETRGDERLDRIVQRGIAAAKLRGISWAARYLALCDVPLETARRVLLLPASRRSGDWA